MTSPPARPPVTPLIAATIAVLLSSVAGQVYGAGQDSTGLSGFAAAAFVGAMLRTGWMLNRPWWQCAVSTGLGPPVRDALPLTATQNANLIALGYAWGGASLLAVYLLSPLRWQHGWQYGCGMLAIGALIALVGRRLRSQWTSSLDRKLTAVTLLHGWAATGGLGWLILTGKIWSAKGDWAANVVFVAGALALTGVSIMALRTSRLLNRAACEASGT